MKMLMFDFRESERDFFNNNELKDFEITFIESPLTDKTELTKEQLEETVVLSVFTTSNITKDILQKFKNLRIIATRSTSYSHIDIKYCIEHSIAVLNVEQYGKTAVAEYAIGLIISIVRNVMPAYYDMKNHTVNPPRYEGRILSSYTIGIIGCGAIGSAVAKIAHFFGMEVLINSYMKNNEISDICNFVSLDELLERSDIISLHVPYDGENYHMLGKDEFEKMKDGVFIVNTARGELIDIKVLYDNLITGKVRAAALDVLECEFISMHKAAPTEIIELSDTNCVESVLIAPKLFKLNNVIITPHIAYNTVEAVNYILTMTFNNIRDNLKGMSTNRIY